MEAGDVVVRKEKGGIDKKKYNLLKAAFKEERDARVMYEIELNKLLSKYQAATKELEETKDKNLQLYEKNIELEERIADYKARARVNENPPSDSEHLKEMLGTQNLLREEMKEKEFFKVQAKEAFEKVVQLENDYRMKERQQFNENSEIRYQVTQIEKKNQHLWDQLEVSKSDIQQLEADKKGLFETIARKEQDMEDL